MNVFILPVTNYYPFYVALEKGFFKEEGIEINFVTPPVETAGVFDEQGRVTEWTKDGVYNWIYRSKGMVANAYIGLWPGELFKIEANHKGILKVFMLSTDTSSHYATNILVKKDSLIKSVLDLKGKKLVCDQHDLGYFLAKYYLEAKGVRDYQFLYMSGSEKKEALISGKIDAIFAGQPRVAIFLHDGIAEILVKNPFNDIPTLSIENPPLRFFVLNSNFIKKNPDTAQRFKRAIKKGLIYSRKHPEEVLLILPKYVISLNKEIIFLLQFGEIEQINRKNKKSLQKLADLFYREGYIDKPINTDNLYF